MSADLNRLKNFPLNNFNLFYDERKRVQTIGIGTKRMFEYCWNVSMLGNEVWRDAFPSIHRLLIACTLPISSAEAERFFSLMKRIKTFTRSTMSEECLSDLAVIAMHYPKRF